MGIRSCKVTNHGEGNFFVEIFKHEREGESGVRIAFFKVRNVMFQDSTLVPRSRFRDCIIHIESAGMTVERRVDNYERRTGG